MWLIYIGRCIINSTMTKVLIATIYQHYSIVASTNKFSIDKVILLIDDNPNETMQKNIQLIEDSLGSIMKIDKIQTDLYDIVAIAQHVVEVIDSIPEKNEIYIDITAGRKPKSLGLLFGSYARIKRIKKISYVTEDTKQIITLPKMAYTINASQEEILRHIKHDDTVTTLELADKLSLSKGLVYRYIKSLVEIDAIDKQGEDVKLTDFGRILLL